MSGNTMEYNRKYARKHRPEILRKRKERYWTDPQYREKLIKRTRLRRAVVKSENPRVPESSFDSEDSRLIIVGDESVRVYNKAAFARIIGVTRPTIDNWHRSGILPVPKDIDAIGRFWYRKDYIEKVNKGLGKYKLKIRKEVLAERIGKAFSG